MLRLLQSAQRRDDPRDAENGRVLLGSLADPNPLLTWEYLVKHHWIRVVWGRWHVPYGLPERPNEDQNEFGKDLVRALAHLKKRGREKPVLAVPNAPGILSEHRSAHPAAPSIATLIDEGVLVRRGGEMFLAPHCAGLRARGSWIAARLWDRTDAGPDGAPRLAWWRDRILGLGFEWFNFGGLLAASARDEFIRLAWNVVLEEADLCDWQAERERMAAQIAANSGLGVADRGLEGARECPESDPVDRLLWVRWASLADVNQEERSEVGALVSVILRWKTAFRSREPWEGCSPLAATAGKSSSDSAA
jgi:hypothetical protein